MEILTLLKANIRYKKGALISVAVLMLIVTASLTAVISANDNFGRNLRDAQKEVDAGDLMLMIEDKYTTKELLDKIKNDPDVGRVRDVEALTSVDSAINGKEVTNHIICIPFQEKERQFFLFNGKGSEFVTKIEALGQGEIYVPSSFQQLYDCKTGSTVTLKTNHGDMEFRIKGFIEEPFLGGYFIGMKQVFLSGTDYNKMLAGNADTVSDTEPRLTKDHMLHIYRKDGSSLSLGEFKRQLSKSTGISDYGTTLSKEEAIGYTLIFNNIGGGILYVFILLLFFIVLIVMGHSISTSIEMDYVNLGVLKSQGFTSKKLRLLFLLQYLLAEGLGAAAGIFVSIPFVRLLGRIFQPITGILATAELSLFKCLLLIAGILLIEVLFLLVKTIRIGRISPVRAISGGLASIYFDSRLRYPLGKRALTLRIALRQFTSNKRQYAGTIAIVSILAYFMISMTILANCMLPETVQESLGGIVTDINLSLNNSFQMDKTKEIETEIEKLSPIKELLYADYKYIAIDGNEYNCVIYNDPEQFKSILKGRAPLYQNEIIITKILSDEIGKNIGVTVTLSYHGKKGEYLISGLYQSMRDVGKCFSMSLAAEQQLTDEQPSDGFVKLVKKEKTADVVSMLNEKFPALLKARASEEDKGIDNMIQLALNMIAITIYTVSILVILVVVNMVCGKVFLKEKKDIGIYKALGFTTRRLRLQFSLRFLLVSALGSAAGVLLCILLNNRMLSLLLRTVGITNFITEYSAFTLLVPIALICSCFFLFSYFTSKKVKNVEIRELITE
ncbi:FtsX-like permease family protein [Anaerocolumna jejuensis DSM 15929]|uniref:FtsX-like permease family protein n=1 Tax=Anaerocolumna jejuensis DSM 15929 TaxID=1121322 RepID=A0A1M6XYG4_9FIRM|nr:ABC transporter permease [Anaerocolumna jejuensis]SHL10878.1 FtsX-like permease family protein [Anaerocolumna jejuensis DSM 15929]